MPSSLAAAYQKARRHLSRRDPVLKRLIADHGTCTLQPHPGGFAVLARAIIAQMISTKAALAIGAKLHALLQPLGLTPKGILAAGEDKVRSAGLSRAKAVALTDLATRVRDGLLPLERFTDMTDEDIAESLVAVRGIGPWTAHMYLMFSLGRLDVLPVDDFGLRAGVQQSYGLDELPGRKALREIGEAWRPYRSVATWYFWRSRGGVPQST
jgi:3-methyladenine DNA glycosylase/8-oxoguanine DNA glycosylase